MTGCRLIGKVHCYIDTRTGEEVRLEHRNPEPCPLPWLLRVWYTYGCDCGKPASCLVQQLESDSAAVLPLLTDNGN